MKKEDLYDKIIDNVSKEVKKVINEKAGVIEFNNFDYKKEICLIAKIITQPTDEYNDVLKIGTQLISGVKKYSFNLSSLTWIDTIHIYYKYSKFEQFDAIALSNGDAAVDSDLFKVDALGHIQYGSIYICDDGSQNISHALFHEMCHLYDNSKFKQIWMNDLEYYLNNQGYDITLYNYYDDVSTYNIDDIHTVITESMRFANFTESHAFMENINFEMFEYLNKFNFDFVKFNNIEKIFMRSSKILYDIYNLEKIVEKLRHIPDSTKTIYMNEYQEEINTAYYGFGTFDKLIGYLYKKLHKILLHARSLFSFYFNLDSKAKQMYKLDESEKKKLQFISYAGGSKRNREVNL